MKQLIGLVITLSLIVATEAACSITTGPPTAMPVATDDSLVFSCLVEEADNYYVQRTDLKTGQTPKIWISPDTNSDTSLYEVNTTTSGTTVTLTVKILKADRNEAGTYQCACLTSTGKSGVMTVLDNPTCTVNTATVVENDNVTLKCQQIYASTAFEVNEPDLYFEDENNQKMAGNVTKTPDTAGKFVANEKSMESSLQATWEDDQREYTCYSKVMSGTSELYGSNCTQKLTVYYSGKNMSILPEEDEYYHQDNLTIQVSANPTPKQYKWTHVDTNTVVAENSIYYIIPNDWSGNTTLKIEVINTIENKDETAVYMLNTTIVNRVRSGGNNLTFTMVQILVPILGAIVVSMKKR